MSLIQIRVEKTGMKIWMILFLLLPLLSSFLCAGAPAQEDETIAWIKNQTTIDAAKLTGKPGMLYFYAGQGTTSSNGARGDVKSKMEKDSDISKNVLPQGTLNNRDVVVLSRKFSCFEYNRDNHPQIAAEYGVIAYPVVIFIDPWANEISRSFGVVSAEILIPFMEIFPEDYSDVHHWKKLLEEDGKDFEALRGMGNFYSNLEAWSLGNDYNNRALKTKFVEENEEVLEDIFLVIGLNELRMRNFKDAQNKFESCLDTITDGKDRDKAFLGLIIAFLGQNKISSAERDLKKLQSQFPLSPAVQQAKRFIQSVKDATSHKDN